jgi:hypothetical protein
MRVYRIEYREYEYQLRMSGCRSGSTAYGKFWTRCLIEAEPTGESILDSKLPLMSTQI